MITTTAIHDLHGLETVRADWARLHRAARPGTPFEHPAWAEAWARSFVPDGRLECVAVRDSTRGGELIGFAPMYRRTLLGQRGAGASLQPLGTGRRQGLTEVVQLLSLPDRTMEVARAVVRHLEGSQDWNWLQLSLSPDQGWFVPQWLEHQGRHLIDHRSARPCVIVTELSPDPGELFSTLKRNVRESVRRSRNRCAKLGGLEMDTAVCVQDVAAALGELTALHRKRAHMQGKVAHDDLVSASGTAEFLRCAVLDLARQGLARIHLMKHRGHAVAGLLVLSDGDTDYLSISGLDPAYWSLSLNTLLTFEALAFAGRARRSAVNLSTGPDVAKLRWSSQIRTWNDFTVVRGDALSRLVHGLYSHATLSLRHHQEQRRHLTRE